MKIYSTVLKVLLVPIIAAAVGVASAHEVTNAVATPSYQNPSGVYPQNANPNMPGNMVPGLPFGASEVVKMHQGGINKDIIVNYIDSAVLPFHLTADNIIYLQSVGIPQEVTKAMIVRDGQLQQQAAMYSQQMGANPANQMAMPPQQQGQPQEPVAMPSTPPPAVGYPSDYSGYYDPGYSSYYVGGYPYYGYGWGWGWPGYYGGLGWRGGYGYGYRGGFRGGFGGGFHGGFGGGGFHGGAAGGGFHGGGGHGGGGHR